GGEVGSHGGASSCTSVSTSATHANSLIQKVPRVVELTNCAGADGPAVRTPVISPGIVSFRTRFRDDPVLHPAFREHSNPPENGMGLASRGVATDNKGRCIRFLPAVWRCRLRAVRPVGGVPAVKVGGPDGSRRPCFLPDDSFVRPVA